MEREPNTRPRGRRLLVGMFATLLGGGCGRAQSASLDPNLTLPDSNGRWCQDRVGSYTAVTCDSARLPLGAKRELDRRLSLQWSHVIEPNPGVEPARPRLPVPRPRPRLRGWSTRTIVDELAKLRLAEAGHPQELVQACDAPEPIRQRIGGVAILLDRGRFQAPAGDDPVELPSRPILREVDDICPSETAGDLRELDSFNGGTLSILDRHHLVGAGHTLLADTVCKAGARLDDYVLAFGVTNETITDHGTIEVPRDQFIDGSMVTVVACHGSKERAQAEGDWVLLRTDECLHAADPVPVRWNQPVAETEDVHTLGHPAQLTMKYSWPSTVVHSDPGFPLFRMDLITDKGHSGAPIFDAQGALVGVHKSRQTGECLVDCRTEGGECCRRTLCVDRDCRGDGYATHIGWVKDAWERSRETISWEGCEPT